MLYAIGDVHGMREKLAALLDALPLRPEDHLLFIGDYVDRGPDSKGAVDLLLEVRKRYRCTFLLGNHESMFLSFLGWKGARYFGGEAFLQNGGDTTLASYGYFSSPAGFRLPPEHEEFFRSCVLWHVEGPYAFVHAGMSREGLSMSDVRYALSKEDPRELLWERYTMELPHSLPCTIVYGHTPQADLEIRWNVPYSIGIDTGCVFGGPLTALRLPDETVFQV
jgi:serine/threonine protein phosphatase 1